MSNFHPGQRVVCIEEHSLAMKIEMAFYGLEAPVKGEVYTVRGLGMIGDDEVVFLEEIVNPVLSYACGTVAELGFHPRRFRPVKDRKADIAVFKAMLNPSRVEEVA